MSEHDFSSGPSRDPDAEYDDEEELEEGMPSRAQLANMTAAEKAELKKQQEYKKWKASVTVIQPLVISDASEDSGNEELVPHTERNKVNPKTDERLEIEKRKVAKKTVYTRKNLYNLSSDEDELDFVQREKDWEVKRNEFRNNVRAK